MMSTPLPDDALVRFRITYRREILSLLRALTQRHQLVSMTAMGSSESVVTSVLHVDDATGTAVVDMALDADANQRILNGEEVTFETTLDRIRIMFSVPKVDTCLFEGRPALQIPLPAGLVRLQRREAYRVPTPVTSPVRCTIPILDEDGRIMFEVAMPLRDISAGGLALIDEKLQIDNAVGKIFTRCRLNLPGSPVMVSLEVLNSTDYSLRTGKHMRKHGCQFVTPSNAVLTAIQCYITKLERERNARANGIA